MYTRRAGSGAKNAEQFSTGVSSLREKKMTEKTKKEKQIGKKRGGSRERREGGKERRERGKVGGREGRREVGRNQLPR